MARDGSGVYHRPVGTDAVTDTTIESTKYNVNVADVEQDLNLPRPIVAGGTGANNAAQAMVNLSGEIAGQVITNYDSQIWQSGSFYSAAGATSAPVAGHAFIGIAYSSDPPALPPANLNVVLEARDESDSSTPGHKYVREKQAGTWVAGGAWTKELLAADNATLYVLKAGDTMTGPLLLAADPTAALGAATKQYSVAKAGDTMTGTLQVNSNIVSAVSASTGNYYFGSSGTKYLGYDAANFNLIGGGLSVSGGDLTVSGASFALGGTSCINSTGAYVSFASRTGTGSIIIGSGSDPSNYYRNTTHTFQNAAASASFASFTSSGLNLTGNLTMSGGINATSTIAGSNVYATDGGTVNQGVYFFGSNAAQFLLFRSGAFSFSTAPVTVNGSLYVGGQFYPAGGGGGNVWQTDGNMVITNQGYKPSGGSWAASSDARIKTVHGDYTQGLAAIRQLEPVRYEYKGNVSTQPPPEGKTREFDHKNVQGKEFVGLIAQAAEIPMPEMVTQIPGEIDGQPVNDLRVLDNSPLIYALVNAVKELAARIEALELP